MMMPKNIWLKSLIIASGTFVALFFLAFIAWTLFCAFNWDYAGELFRQWVNS